LCSCLVRLAREVVEQKSTQLPPGSGWREGGIVSAASPRVGQAPGSFSVTELLAVHEAMAHKLVKPEVQSGSLQYVVLDEAQLGPEKLMEGQLGPWKGGQRMRPGERQRAPSCVTEGLCGA
jgi:hypothetical protein